MAAEREEEIVYADTGCHLHPSCLACPEVICVLEFPGGKRGLERFVKVFAMKRSGMTSDQIARKMQMSRRVVNRVLSRSKRLPPTLRAYLETINELSE